MRKTSLMESRFADDGRGSEGELASTARTQLRKRAGEDQDGADAILIFERGVVAMGQQKVAAIELATSESHLADYLRGDKTIAFHRVVRMCRKNQDAALALIGELSRISGLAPPQRPRKVSKREAQDATTRKVRGILQLWQIVRADVATDLETTVDDVESALDEVTGETRFAK